MWPFTHTTRHAPHRIPTSDEDDDNNNNTSVITINENATRVGPDVLALVFSFLIFPELMVIQRVCRDWYNATIKERPRSVHVDLNEHKLVDMCTTTSSLRRHVGSVAFSSNFIPSVIVLETLQNLPRRVQLTIRTQQVELWLLHVPHITRLEVDTMQYTPVSIIIQLTSLRVLQTANGQWALPDIERLGEMNTLHQLQQLSLHGTILDVDAMSALNALPTLTAIEPLAIAPSAYRLLPRFRHLKRLNINMLNNLGWNTDPNEPHWSTHLLGCQQLTHITLSTHQIYPIIERFVLAVPRLESLCVRQTIVVSLQFLQYFPDIKTLHLIRCGGMTQADVMHLNEWAPGLTELRIEHCLSINETCSWFGGTFSFNRNQTKRMLAPGGHLHQLKVFVCKRDNSDIHVMVGFILYVLVITSIVLLLLFM